MARRFLNLSSAQESTDINAIIGQISGTLRQLAGESVDLITLLSPRLPRTLVPQHMMEKLLTGLVRQASAALPLGGVVTVETRLGDVDEAHEPSTLVVLSITASGCGVQPLAASGALEPFVAACRGEVRTGGDPDTGVTLEVSLPTAPPSRHDDRQDLQA